MVKPLLKQRFTYVISKKKKETNQLYTSFATDATLLQTDEGKDKQFKFNDQICGSWIGVADSPYLCITFRGGGNSDNQPKVLHVFEQINEYNYELLPITDKVYDEVSQAFPNAVQHYNTDRVELIRIFD